MKLTLGSSCSDVIVLTIFLAMETPAPFCCHDSFVNADCRLITELGGASGAKFTPAIRLYPPPPTDSSSLSADSPYLAPSPVPAADADHSRDPDLRTGEEWMAAKEPMKSETAMRPWNWCSLMSLGLGLCLLKRLW